ncbi:MAG: DNA polymerase III subunit [Anaerolineae bacterium]|nr:DNA polymerase III subunit [Anaerolineae bacterium]
MNEKTNLRWAETWGMIGHEWAISQLRKSLLNHRARHGYLIVGPESVGKETLARAFAMALNCLHKSEDKRPCGECSSCQRILSGNHPDILYSQQDSHTGALKVEEVRSFASKLALKPYEARHRVAILRNFDRAQPLAQDALLKTLEEPAPHSMLILLAEDIGRILPTITSRSQMIMLRPVPARAIALALRDEYGADESQSVLLAQLSGGRPGWAIRAAEQPELLNERAEGLEQLQTLLGENRAGRFAAAETLSKDKAVLLDRLELWQTFWRDVMLLAEASGIQAANVDKQDYLSALAGYLTPEEALKALKATRELISTLSSTNANARLALEVLLLDYPGL